MRRASNRQIDLAFYMGLRGNRAMEAGDLERAAAWLTAAERVSPGYLPTLYWRGKLARAKGHNDAARRLFQAAASSASRHDFRAAALVDLAEALDDDGEHDQALAAARRAIAVQAMGNNTDWTRYHQSRAYRRLGRDAAERGDADEAPRCQKEAARLSPDSPSALLALADAHMERDERADAVACLRKAADLAQGDAEIHGRVGNRYAQLAEYAAAAGEYLRAIELAPNDARGHDGLGCALSRLGYHEEAERQIREAVRLDPNDLRTQTNLAVVLKDRHGHRPAARWLRQVIRAHPDCAEAHLRLAYVLWRHASRKTVCASLQRALDLDPDGETGRSAREALARWEEPG